MRWDVSVGRGSYFNNRTGNDILQYTGGFITQADKEL